MLNPIPSDIKSKNHQFFLSVTPEEWSLERFAQFTALPPQSEQTPLYYYKACLNAIIKKQEPFTSVSDSAIEFAKQQLQCLKQPAHANRKRKHQSGHGIKIRLGGNAHVDALAVAGNSASVISSGPSASSATSRHKPQRDNCTCKQTFLRHFASMYSKMSDSDKWILPTGKCVEDVLYNRFKDWSFEHAAHSWIIDMDDSTVRNCFTSEEWKSISLTIPELPPPEHKLIKWMSNFATFESPAELGCHLNTNAPIGPSEEFAYDSSEWMLRCWIWTVLQAWTNLCRNPSNFTRNHQEDWYVSNFWKTLFDDCMTTIEGAYVARGEAKANTTSARKNDPSDRSKRRRVGRLFDALLAINDLEIGAVEHSRIWAESAAPKWNSDSLKVLKALHDMLHAMGSIPNSQVVGFVTAGWHCQLLRMMYGKGYVCLVVPDDLRKVPTNHESILPLLQLLTIVLRIRTILSSIYLPKKLTVQQVESILLKSEPLVTPNSIPPSVETDHDCTDQSEHGASPGASPDANPGWERQDSSPKA